MQRVSQAVLGSPLLLVVWMTTEGLLNEYGPLASIWLQSVARRRTGAQPGGLVADQKRSASSRSPLPLARESALIHKAVDA